MRNNLLILCILFATISQAQWQLSDSLKAANSSLVSADHLSNVYWATDGTLNKYDFDKDEYFVYNNPGLGAIEYINVFNPFNILVYYKDYNQYVFLDNKLNPNLNAFSPSNNGYFDVQLAAVFDQNNIWFYDQVTDKIYKWSLTQNKLLHTSLQINQLSSYSERPNFIYATLKNVYLNIPDIGILVFDNFGSYQRTLPIKNLNQFYLSKSSIVFEKEGLLEKFNDFTKSSTNFKLPTAQYLDLYYNQDKLYLLTENLVKIYTLEVK